MRVWTLVSICGTNSMLTLNTRARAALNQYQPQESPCSCSTVENGLVWAMKELHAAAAASWQGRDVTMFTPPGSTGHCREKLAWQWKREWNEKKATLLWIPYIDIFSKVEAKWREWVLLRGVVRQLADYGRDSSLEACRNNFSNNTVQLQVFLEHCCGPFKFDSPVVTTNN